MPNCPFRGCVVMCGSFALTAITLYNGGNHDGSLEHLNEFKQLFDKLDEDTKNSDPDVPQKYHILYNLLK